MSATPTHTPSMQQRMYRNPEIVREEVARAIVTAHMRGKRTCLVCVPAYNSYSLTQELRTKGYTVNYSGKYPTKKVCGRSVKDWSRDLINVAWGTKIPEQQKLIK